MHHLTPVQYDLVYNMISLGLASMMASTVFFFLRVSSFTERYKAALCFTGLVTFIAMYHYFRIFNSFEDAFTPCEVLNGTVNKYKCDPELYGYSPTGIAFNDAYRYVDWLLTVPLLLIEIVLVMKLNDEETFSRCCTLGIASALMIANGYPGETSANPQTRWGFWILSMIPFTYIVYTLFYGLKAAQEKQPASCRDHVKYACYATVFSWCTYPIVYVFPMLAGTTEGRAGLPASTMVAVQIGYTFSDVISKCGVGYLVYRIGLAKSRMEKRAAYRGISVDELEEIEGDGSPMAVFKADISDRLTNFESTLKEIQVTQESMQFAQKEILRVVNPEAFHELEAAEAARLEEAAREQAALMEEAAEETAGEEGLVEVPLGEADNAEEEDVEEKAEEEQDDTEKDDAENKDENEEESLIS